MGCCLKFRQTKTGHFTLVSQVPATFSRHWCPLPAVALSAFSGFRPSLLCTWSSSFHLYSLFIKSIAKNERQKQHYLPSYRHFPQQLPPQNRSAPARHFIS